MATARIATYQKMYVWELPVRIFHWLNVLAILSLIATGYLIGAPQKIFDAAEPSQQYWFGIVRFTHFAAAYVFFFNYLFRLYWGFVGNKYARWSEFIPVTKKRLKEFYDVVMVDILHIRNEREVGEGHNTLAGLSYFVAFLIFLFQAGTGFALYSSMSDSFIPSLFAWIVPLMGGDAWVRQWHHIAMWFFIVFTIVHVYLVIYHDWVEGAGETSSMISGWKFRKDESDDGE